MGEREGVGDRQKGRGGDDIVEKLNEVMMREILRPILTTTQVGMVNKWRNKER